MKNMFFSQIHWFYLDQVWSILPALELLPLNWSYQAIHTVISACYQVQDVNSAQLHFSYRYFRPCCLDESEYTWRWADQTEFLTLKVTPKMGGDHMPNRVLEVLNMLIPDYPESVSVHRTTDLPRSVITWFKRGGQTIFY